MAARQAARARWKPFRCTPRKCSQWARGAISGDAQWMPALRCVTNFGLDGGALLGSGFNGKMSEFAAAIGLAQDAAFDDQLTARRAAAKRYTEFFSTHAPDWAVAVEPGDPPWQAFLLLAPDAQQATDLLEGCARRGVQLR